MHRLGKDGKLMGGSGCLWRNGGMTTDVKMRLLETIVVPTVLYRSVMGAGYKKREGRRSCLI